MIHGFEFIRCCGSERLKNDWREVPRLQSPPHQVEIEINKNNRVYKMPTGNVNSLQRDSSTGAYLMKNKERNLRFVFFFGLVFLPIAAFSQTPLRRIVIVAPPQAPDAQVEAVYRETKLTRKRPAKLPKGQKPPGIPSLPVLSEKQWEVLATRLYFDALRDRARTRLKAGVASEEDTLQKRSELALSFEALEKSANVTSLMNSLKGDAVLILGNFRLAKRQAGDRSLLFTGELRVDKKETPGASTRFPIAGYAGFERSLITGDPTKSELQLVREATRSAAFGTIHTLKTGQIFPLSAPGIRIALCPTPSPRTADRLRFNREGRTSELGALSGMASDVSALFVPSLLPISRTGIQSVETVRRALNARHWTSSDLWDSSNRPVRLRVQEIGKTLEVDYVMMARIGQVEVDGDALMPSLEGVLFEGRAEAVGALVRISDGMIVWTDRVATSLSVRSPPKNDPAGKKTDYAILERKTLRDAIRFALLQLTRRFNEYRDGFSE